MKAGKLFINNLSVNELDEILTIQQQAYNPFLWESKDIFFHKLHLFPQGCWIARRNRIPVAYLISHPWSRNRIIPFNEKIDCLPQNPNCFYIHDLAVAPPFRGQGIGRQLIEKAFWLAQMLQFNMVSLVAVQNSSTFWAKFGFKLQERSTEDIVKDLQPYGENAQLMTAQIK